MGEWAIVQKKGFVRTNGMDFGLLVIQQIGIETLKEKVFLRITIGIYS